MSHSSYHILFSQSSLLRHWMNLSLAVFTSSENMDSCGCKRSKFIQLLYLSISWSDGGSFNMPLHELIRISFFSRSTVRLSCLNLRRNSFTKISKTSKYCWHSLEWHSLESKPGGLSPVILKLGPWGLQRPCPLFLHLRCTDEIGNRNVRLRLP